MSSGSKAACTPLARVAGVFCHASGLHRVLVFLVLLPAVPARAQITDAALEAWVETEYPIVKYATDDWVRVQALREFSYKHTAAPTGATHEDGTTIRAYQLGVDNVENVLRGTSTLGDGYAFFDNYGGGGLCGQYTAMLERLYQLYGYNAIELDLGFNPRTPSGSTFGHAQTLAQITRDGKSYITVNDPTPNLSYTWADGRSPIDYRDMIWLLAQNKSKYISYSGVSSALDARFSTTNGRDFNVYPNSPNNVPPATTQLGFDADTNGNVSGRIDFPTAISTIDLDVTNFNGGTVSMTAYDTIGRQIGQVSGTDQNHLTISASAIKYILLTGNNNGARLNISNLQTKIINPTINFTYGQGFTDANAINRVGPKLNASFSTSPTAGLNVYPPPPNNTQLYFNPDPSNDHYVTGRIDFPKAVSSVDFDVVYFGGGAFTMYVYDGPGNLLGQVQGADQPGQNHVSFVADVQASRLIEHVILFGRQAVGASWAAINLTNLQTKIISPVIDFSHGQGFIHADDALDQNNNDHRHYINGVVDGARNNPNMNNVGYFSDQSNPDVALGSGSVDVFNANYTRLIFSDRWVYKSPRTIARFEALGDQTDSWKDQLIHEGRPGETIYLHTFPETIPLRRDYSIFRPVVDLAKRMLNDFRIIKFTYAEGFTAADPTATNTVAARMNARLSVINGENGGYFSVYPYPPDNHPPNVSQVGFAADRYGYVGGRIDFPVALTAIDLDNTFFNGATAVMYAYDGNGNLLKQVQGRDQPGQNHLGITADSGTSISYVILWGVANGGAGLNVTNLQLRTLGPSFRFTYADGFTSSDTNAINNVAAQRNVSFSTLNGAGFSIYPPPPNNMQLYFNADGSGNVAGRIDFLTPISGVDLDVNNFNGGIVTMTAYDASGNSLGQVQGTDQPGAGLDRLNHLSLAGNPGVLQPIKYVVLTGNNGGAAINITNLRLSTWWW